MCVLGDRKAASSTDGALDYPDKWDTHLPHPAWGREEEEWRREGVSERVEEEEGRDGMEEEEGEGSERRRERLRRSVERGRGISNTFTHE